MGERASPGLRLPGQRTESGRGYLSLFITLSILAAVGYTSVKVVPLYVDNFQLSDYTSNLARELAVNQVKPEAIPNAVAEKAETLNLPVSTSDVKVINGESSVRIRVSYGVPIDLKVYTWTLHFSASASAPKLVY